MLQRSETVALYGVLETRELAEEGEIDLADRAVTLLRDDELGEALSFRRRVVDLVAGDEEDDVGVLLDGARLAKVGHHRPLVLPCVDAAVELRQRDHRDFELLGKALERARDLRDLGRPVLLAAVAGAGHELKVIDDDEA